MDSDAALHLELVGVVALGAAVVVLAAVVSGACSDASTGRRRKRAQVEDVERALGDEATLMTYERAAARKKAASSSSPPPTTEGVDMCVICQSEYDGADERVRMLQCDHFFHAECIDRWLRKYRQRCPLCRGGMSSLPPLPKPGCPPMLPRTSRPAVSTTAIAAAVVD